MDNVKVMFWGDAKRGEPMVLSIPNWATSVRLSLGLSNGDIRITPRIYTAQPNQPHEIATLPETKPEP